MIAEQRGLPVSDRPLRVLWLIKGLGTGGAERLLVQSARYRDRDRIIPTVAYLMPEKSSLVESLEREGHVQVRGLDARSSWDPRWIWRLGRRLRSERFDVVHIHSPLVAVGSRLAVRSLLPRRRPRIVVTEHNVWASHTRLSRFADRWTAGSNEVHLAVSAAVRASLPRALRSRARVVRYGVDAAQLRNLSRDRDAVRRSLGISPDELLIGTVANLRATKGYPDLLNAAREVVRRVDAARFVAVARGPLERELRELHSRLGLGDRFTFLGFHADAARVMSAFDIFCLPSHHEGLPIALMEALALGLPIDDDPEAGLAVFRLRRRGGAVEAGVSDLFVPKGAAETRRRLLRRIARDTGADYAVSGPILTWRLADPAALPARSDLDLSLGDMELL